MKNKSIAYKIKIPKNFLLFVILSLLFWLLITLSKEYKTEISFPVTYVNLPQDKLFQEPPPATLKIRVKGTGFKILSANFSPNVVSLETNYLKRKKTSKYYLLLKNQQGVIQKQLNFGVEINNFSKDSLFLDLGYLATKKVPVIPSLDIEYKAGYDLSDTIRVVPDSISISGSKEAIQALEKLRTKKLILSDVTEDISKEVFIALPSNTNIKVNTTKVLIRGKVDKFTEGNLETSFTIENVPDGVVINTFPKKVKIIFKVGLRNFNEIKENSFKVVCNYKVSEENNYAYLIPEIISQSEFIKSARIVPNKIDFLIQK